MASIAIVVGRLGNDVTLNQAGPNHKVAHFSVADTDYWKDKVTGERKERTEWHNIEAWDGLAEVCSKYLKKGSLVFVTGSPEDDSFDGKDGKRIYKKKIKADKVQFLDPGRTAALRITLDTLREFNFNWQAIEAELNRITAEHTAKKQPANIPQLPPPAPGYQYVNVNGQLYQMPIGQVPAMAPAPTASMPIPSAPMYPNPAPPAPTSVPAPAPGTMFPGIPTMPTTGGGF